MGPEDNPTGQETQPVDDNNSGDDVQQPSGTGNPAWQPFLDVLPSSLHPTVTPVLQEWDKGVQTRFQEIHQQYEPYKAYQELIDNEIGMDAIIPALQLLEQLNNDPKQVWEALGQHFQFGAEQSDPEDLDSETEGFRDPRIDELEAGFRQLAERELARNQQSEEAQADQELDDLLSQAHETYGDFNERIVLGLMLSGMEIDEAIQEYQANNTSILEAFKRPPAPNVMSRGSVPAPNVDTKNLSGKDRRALVAQMLQQASDT